MFMEIYFGFYMYHFAHYNCLINDPIYFFFVFILHLSIYGVFGEYEYLFDIVIDFKGAPVK